MDDYAVVVGVAQYPELSAAGIASDLDGPNNDATAVVAPWASRDRAMGREQLPPGRARRNLDVALWQR